MEKSEKIAIMEKAGVFDIKSGSVVLRFDEHGALRKIEREDVLFDIRFKKPTVL